MIMDVGRNRPTSWILEDHKGSERACAKELCAFLGPDDLLLGDRGYPSFAFFQQLIDQRTHFLIRVCTHKNGTLREISAFLQSEKTDSVITVTRGKKSAPQSIRLRIIKQRLKNGTLAAYATNLYNEQERLRQHICSM